jgi:hypothetical protein
VNRRPWLAVASAMVRSTKYGCIYVICCQYDYGS